MATTASVLADLGLEDRRQIVVFNKIDRLTEPTTRARLERTHPDALFVSARSGEGLDLLVRCIDDERASTEIEAEISISNQDPSALTLLYRNGRVVEVCDDGDHLRVRVRTSPAGAGRIRRRLDERRAHRDA